MEDNDRHDRAPAYPSSQIAMTITAENALLHAALLCGMTPGVPAYRLQLFFVANLTGSPRRQSHWQRTLETAVDKKGLFENIDKGHGEYALTKRGHESAIRAVGLVPPKYTPTRRADFRCVMSGVVEGRRIVRVQTVAEHSTVTIDGEPMPATDACRTLGITLPRTPVSAVKLLQDFGIDRLFEVAFD